MITTTKRGVSRDRSRISRSDSADETGVTAHSFIGIALTRNTALRARAAEPSASRHDPRADAKPTDAVLARRLSLSTNSNKQ